MEQTRRSARIVFDITHSIEVRTQTRPDGILRVERNLALHALRQTSSQVQFCRFDRVGRQLVPVSYEEAEAALTAWRRPPVESLEERTNWNRFKRFLRRNWRLLKAWPIWGLSNFIFHRVSRRRIDLSEGDIYVNVGPTWAYSDVAAIAALKRHRNFRAVFFVHDLIPILYPHFFYSTRPDVSRFKRYYDGVATCADKVICNSDCTQNDFEQYVNSRGIAGPEHSVLICGSDTWSEAPLVTPVDCAKLEDREYVLAVSTIENRKNHRLLYNLWARFAERKDGGLARLVVAGQRGWLVEDLLREIRRDPRTKDHIVLMNFVSEQELAWLYKNCLFTVYPSLYEGWGLPVVESLAHGKYCLASSAASLPQAGQGLIKHIDPLDFAAWYAEVDRLISDPEYLARRERKVVTEYRPRSWREAGDDFLEQVLSTPRLDVRPAQDGIGVWPRLPLVR